MYTEVQSSDRIVPNELRCTDTYVWLSVHYIKLPKYIYKTERERLRGATLSCLLTTLQICFKLKTSSLDYFFKNCKYKQTSLVMTNLAFQIPILSVLSYSNFYQKKTHKPLELFRHFSFLRLRNTDLE